MGLVTRIIMHIKDKGSKKHGVGPGVMGQPNQPPGNLSHPHFLLNIMQRIKDYERTKLCFHKNILL